MMSNFLFCHKVFNNHLLQMLQNASEGWKGLRESITDAVTKCYMLCMVVFNEF